jgi:hypothetical protein
MIKIKNIEVKLKRTKKSRIEKKNKKRQELSSFQYLRVTMRIGQRFIINVVQFFFNK